VALVFHSNCIHKFVHLHFCFTKYSETKSACSNKTN